MAEGFDENEVKKEMSKCSDIVKPCDPEDWFDVIEKCKICGRLI